MQTATQFSVFLINKPGVLAQVIGAVAAAKVNIIALTIVDASEHGALRLVGDSPQRLRETLSQLNLPMVETPVVLVELSNRPGALADVLGRLAQEHVNIEYAYVTAGAPGGKTTGILKVDNLEKTDKVLRGKAKHGGARSDVRGFRNRGGMRA